MGRRRGGRQEEVSRVRAQGGEETWYRKGDMRVEGVGYLK